MRSNTYVFIDAHIIRCRLHHNNNLKYSVALKSGKEQQVATDYKPSKDFVIEMDTHLALQADKYSYDNFPKLTLIVNVMNESGERKAVGTTFANFRKEGVQIFQVSECSCKDKAFEVEISFSLKLAELKGSKSSNNKNPLTLNKKSNYLSQQPTPKDSREIKQERLTKQVKAESKGDSQQKIQKLNKIHSEKILPAVKQSVKIAKGEEKPFQQLIKQIQYLTYKIKLQEVQLSELRCFQQEFQNCRQKNDHLSELLQIQEEKNQEAMKYISNLQHSIQGFMPKQHPKLSVACTTSFKVIQELDEIVQMNRQLQNDLQAQRQKNSLLELEVEQLKQQLNILLAKQQQAQKLEAFQQISFINLNKQIFQPNIHNNQILITSICKEKIEDSIITRQKQKLEDLTVEVMSLTNMVDILRIQIDKLEALKRQLENNPTKKNPQKKTSPAKVKPVKQELQPYKSEKGASKDKNWKPPKTIKKTVTNSPSSIQAKGKQSVGGQAKTSLQLSPVIKIAKLESTEVESKTERQQSIEKSSDLSLEQNPQRNIKTYSEAVYFTDGFQN